MQRVCACWMTAAMVVACGVAGPEVAEPGATEPAVALEPEVGEPVEEPVAVGPARPVRLPRVDPPPSEVPAPETCDTIVAWMDEPEDPYAETGGVYARCGVLGMGAVRFHAFTPSGDIVVGTSAGQVARVDPTGAVQWKRWLFEEAVQALAVSADGRFVAASGYGWIRVLDAQQGHTVRLIASKPNLIGALAFSPDGCAIASGALVDKTEPGLVVRSLVTTEPIWDSASHEQTLAIAYSPDGTKVGAVVKGNGYTLGEPAPVWVQVRDAADGVLLRSVPGESFAWLPASDVIVVGRESGEIVRVDTATGKTVSQQVYGAAAAKGDSPRMVIDIAALPDGRVITAGVASYPLRVLDGETLETLQEASFWSLGRVAVSPAGDMLAMTRKGQLFTRPVAELDSVDDPAIITPWEPHISISETGVLAAVASNGVAHVLDLETGDTLLEVALATWGSRAAVSADGTRLVASVSTGLQLVDVASGEVLGTFEESPSNPSALAISPDGAWVTAALGASRVALWRTADLGREATLPEDPINEHSAIFDHVRAVAFSPDSGLLVAAGGGFYQTRVWALDDLSETALNPKAVDVAFAPDGGAMVVVPYAWSTTPVRHYEVPGFVWTDLAVDTAKQTALAWNAHGLLVAAAKATLLVDPTTGATLQELPGSKSLATTADGAIVVTATKSGTLDVWCSAP